MDIGLIVGLVAAAIGVVAAVVAVVVSLRSPRGTWSGGRYFRGVSVRRNISTDVPASPDPSPDDETATQVPRADWANGTFGEGARTRKGGSASQSPGSNWLWRLYLIFATVVVLAVAGTNGFGSPHPGQVIALAIVAVFAVGIGLFVLTSRSRSRDWERVAADHGWHYTRYDIDQDDALSHQWAGPPFGRGRLTTAHNVITGSSGDAPFTAFDYSYTLNDSQGGGQRSYQYSVVVRPLGFACPNVQVTPASLLGRVRRHDEGPFDQAWDVAVPNDASLELLTTQVRDWLMRPDHRHLALRVEGSDLLTWQEDWIAPGALPSVLALLDEFAALIAQPAQESRGEH